MKLFVGHESILYGKTNLTYNMHVTIHLVEDAKRYGCLDNVSGFVFESYLGRLKKLIRKPQFPLQQVVRRLSERSVRTIHVPVCNLQKEHCAGPVPRQFMLCHQFREYHQPTFKITLRAGNNCIEIFDQIALVRNFIEKDTKQFVVYQTFASQKPWFNYPLISSDIGIYELAGINDELHVALVSEIQKKYVLLKRDEKTVAIPLLHC